MAEVWSRKKVLNEDYLICLQKEILVAKEAGGKIALTWKLKGESKVSRSPALPEDTGLLLTG